MCASKQRSGGEGKAAGTLLCSPVIAADGAIDARTLGIDPPSGQVEQRTDARRARDVGRPPNDARVRDRQPGARNRVYIECTFNGSRRGSDLPVRAAAAAAATAVAQEKLLLQRNYCESIAMNREGMQE